jgi:hypothetical protein
MPEPPHSAVARPDRRSLTRLKHCSLKPPALRTATAAAAYTISSPNSPPDESSYLEVC